MEQTGKKELWQGWRTVQLLGRGGYGEVYEVERDMEGLVPEKAAVKRIPIPQDQREIDRLRARGYQDEEIAEYYKKRLLETLKEYRITAELKGHPNIVGCDDIRYEQQADGIGWDVFVKMELLLPLSRAIDSFTREKQVAKLGKDVLRALIQCEKKGIACSGVKPQNIFLSKSGDCKLGDIGIAKMTDRKGKEIDDPDFSAPEVLEGAPHSRRSDIYSLGMVLYWMLNERRVPFVVLPPEVPNSADREEAIGRRLSGEPFPDPVHGSEELIGIVQKACAFRPEERYKSAQEMLDDLEEFTKSNAGGWINGERNPVRPVPISIPLPKEEETEDQSVELFDREDPEAEEETLEEETPEEEEPAESGSRLSEKQRVLLMVAGAILLLLLTVVIASLTIWSCSNKKENMPVVQTTEQPAVTEVPTDKPEAPTVKPTDKPTPEPTKEPTAAPTATPTPGPTATPKTPKYFTFGGQQIAPGADTVDIAGKRDARIKISKEEMDQLVYFCPKLKKLSLDYCDIADCSRIGELTSLTELLITTTGNINGVGKMSDISWVRSLTKLRRISFAHNAISDISAIEDLTGLERLNLADNRLENSDLQYLCNLQSLQNLYLYSNTELSDVSDLAELENLVLLHLGGCRLIDDISMLTDLPFLREMNLGSLDKLSYSYFKDFKTLDTLWLQGCNASRDYTGLAACKRLKKVYIYSNDTKLESTLKKAIPKVTITKQG